MKRCGGCGQNIRKATLVFMSDGKGGLARKRIGSCCAGRAVPLLVGSIEASRCPCGAPATTCTPCARDADKRDLKKLLKAAVEKLRKLARAYPGERGEALEQAADVVEGGDL